MDLTQFLERHPNVRSFQKEMDQHQIFKLMNLSPMRLKYFDLFYDRTPDFDNLLKAQSEKSFTLVLNEKGKLLVVCSFIPTTRYRNGEKVNICYICDMRTITSRNGPLLWRKFYADFINESLLMGNKFNFTAVLSDNRDANSNLIHPKKDRGFKYDQVITLNMVNVFGRKPYYFKKGISKWNPKSALKLDEEKILEFLEETNRKKLFGFCFKDFEWNLRKSTWANFSIEGFIVVEDKNGKILSLCFPWSPGDFKRMRIDNLSFFLKFAIRVVNLLGFSLPLNKEVINTLYLTHLAFYSELPKKERLAILESYVEYILTNKKKFKFHMISFADEFGLMDLKSNFKKKFFIQKTKVNLFTVRPSHISENRFSQEDLKNGIGFEMALV